MRKTLTALILAISVPLAASNLDRTEIMKSLIARSEQDEFMIVYLPDSKKFVDITEERGVDYTTFNSQMLESLVSSGQKLHLIHNHNSRELSSDSKKCPLYWLSPSPQDIYGYLSIVDKASDTEYSIINKYGMLTISADKELLGFRHLPSFPKLIADEVEHIQGSLCSTRPEDLETWASDYRGILRLNFEHAK